MHTLVLLATQTAENAAAETPGAAGGLISLLPFLLIGAVFYFLIIRPQKNRQRAQQALINAVSIGDRVVTIGGFHATVLDVSEDVLQVEIAPGTVVTIAKQAVARTLEDPALHDLDDLDLDEADLDVDDRDDGRGGTA